MPFLGELAALGTSLCFSFGSVMFTNAGRMIGAALVNRMRLLMALLVVMLWHALTYGQVLPFDAAPERWFWLGVSGLVGFVLGDAFLFQSFVMIGPRLAMLMMALAPVLSSILAAVFLKESLVPMELLGIGVTLAGIVVVISERRGRREDAPADNRRYLIGLLCGLGAAVGQAGGLILSKLGLAGDFPALSGNVIRLLAAVLAIWAIAAVNRQVFSSIRAVRAAPRAVLLMSGGVILGPVLGVWLSLVAVQNTNVGVASTLSSLMPIFLIPISYFAFGERVTRQAVVGTVLAFVGMVVLFL
ncbi:MAG: DMT family transporter [Chloroflexi bacterium]|nr:DMT family transporter [Chloroflexota bacterium]